MVLGIVVSPSKFLKKTSFLQLRITEQSNVNQAISSKIIVTENDRFLYLMKENEPKPEPILSP
jgi:hypothetical protein